MPNTLKGGILAVIALLLIVVVGFSMASISAIITSFLVGVTVGFCLAVYVLGLIRKRSKK